MKLVGPDQCLVCHIIAQRQKRLYLPVYPNLMRPEFVSDFGPKCRSLYLFSSVRMFIGIMHALAPLRQEGRTLSVPADGRHFRVVLFHAGSPAAEKGQRTVMIAGPQKGDEVLTTGGAVGKVVKLSRTICHP